jgi:hypothetical protein
MNILIVLPKTMAEAKINHKGEDGYLLDHEKPTVVAHYLGDPIPINIGIEFPNKLLADYVRTAYSYNKDFTNEKALMRCYENYISLVKSELRDNLGYFKTFDQQLIIDTCTRLDVKWEEGMTWDNLKESLIVKTYEHKRMAILRSLNGEHFEDIGDNLIAAKCIKHHLSTGGDPRRTVFTTIGKEHDMAVGYSKNLLGVLYVISRNIHMEDLFLAIETLTKDTVKNIYQTLIKAIYQKIDENDTEIIPQLIENLKEMESSFYDDETYAIVVQIILERIHEHMVRTC